MIDYVTKFYGFFSARIEVLKKAIDVRDVLVAVGLISTFYGFYLLFPWLGFVAFGSLSMLLGLGWLVRIPK